MEKEIQLNEHNKQEHRPSHTAEHMINRAMINNFGCGRAVEAHIERKKSKMDFALPKAPTEEQIRKVEAEVNSMIDKDMTVAYEYISQAEASTRYDLRRLPEGASDTVRVVKIGDYDDCLCVGQHVDSTAEIGKVSIVSYDYNAEKQILRIRFKTQAQ